MNEALTKAEHGLQMARDDLREALRNGTATAALLLTEYIGQAATLERDIRALRNAVEQDQEGGA